MLTVERRIDSFNLTPLSYSRRLWLLLLSLIFTLSISSMLALAIGTATRAQLLFGSSVQNVLVFAGSAIVVAFFVSRQPFIFLGVTQRVGWRPFAGAILLLLVGMPFLNQTVWWNEHIVFPESAVSLEVILREMEEIASATSEAMLATDSVGGLIAGVLVVGVLTGVCEELFFRGATQRVIASSGMSPHAAIWIAAFIFSTLHFQFFGFVPRLLLGALFGYLFYWSGSIWVSASVHALNNSLVVLTVWLSNRGMELGDIDNFGVANSSFPLLALVSLVAVVLLMICGKKYFFKSKD